MNPPLHQVTFNRHRGQLIHAAADGNFASVSITYDEL
jgi:hypothetical protein